jgi:glycosyltransferase involved in cell wall biosynthesis
MSNRADASRTRLAIVGTDLKFIEPLMRRFDESGCYRIRVDEWPKFRVHDEHRTREVLNWADTIVCEWAGPNAVIAARLKRPDQRLVVRLHRMELSHDHWKEIDIDAVDVVVAVGSYYRRRIIDTTGWPAEKVIVVPNAIDTAAFDLPKRPGAIHNIGMIGAASSRKRLDLGLDVLDSVRAVDDRFHLFVKGAIPWGLKWVEDRPEEVEFFDMIQERLETDLLAGAVTFDPPGTDVDVWLQKIGFVLSTSDDESFHLSPAEGMASRAIPLIRPWPGANEVYDESWVVDGAEAMAERILGYATDQESWTAAGARARDEIVSSYDLDAISETWMESVLEGPPSVEGLRISVVSSRNPYNDPGMLALVNSLDAVGHAVSVVSPADPGRVLPSGVAEHQVRLRPRRLSWAWFRHRLGGRGDDDRREAKALGETLRVTRPDLVYPHRAEDLAVAEAVGAPVLRAPGWPIPRHDLITIAPHDAALSRSPKSGVEPLPEWPAYMPEPGRHGDVKAVVAYRVSPTSPGRYLESALRQAGVSVDVMDGVLDWGRVDDDCAFVVIVESPYPALDVHGVKPSVPTLFWVHHGEHHLAANVRLTDRYQADAVLLAHSWHLAHRFGVPTHRFPFGFPSELSARAREWPDRHLDVAMVGAGIGGSGHRYDRRREIVESIQSDGSISSRMTYGLRPEEMIALYSDARIVLNDGGPRHFPITMRVFEAVGAGALLLTEDIPGTDTILRRNEHYVPMDRDVATQVHTLIEDEESAAIAAAGRKWVLSRHTYGHRVDQLLKLAERLDPDTTQRAPFPPLSPLAALVDQDVEVQSLAVFGHVDDTGLRDRAVRVGDVDRLGEKSIDAVVIGNGPIDDLVKVVAAARGYIYATSDHATEVSDVLAATRPRAVVGMADGMLKADLGGSPYRTRPVDHPLS